MVELVDTLLWGGSDRLGRASSTLVLGTENRIKQKFGAVFIFPHKFRKFVSETNDNNRYEKT